MGIGDTKIDKSALGALAKRTIQKGNFNRFAENFSKDVSSKGLTALSSNINSAKSTIDNSDYAK